MSKNKFDMYAVLSKPKSEPEKAGKAGEYFAEQLFKLKGWNYEKLPQNILELPKLLKAFGGKRPDYIIEAKPECENTIIVVDAKYHSTENCSKWYMENDEIIKYNGLKKYLEDQYSNYVVYVLFILFPKESNGNKVIFVSLSDFNEIEISYKGTTPIKKINLSSGDFLVEDCILYKQ